MHWQLLSSLSVDRTPVLASGGTTQESSVQPCLGMSAGVTSLMQVLSSEPLPQGSRHWRLPLLFLSSPCLRWTGVHGKALLLWGALAPGILRAPHACVHLIA